MTDPAMTAQREAIAVIGIGCRFPGGISDAGGFWRFLAQGRNAVAEIPADRIDIGRYFDARPATRGRMMTRWGGFLDGIDLLDADFFGISPREAERLDPQQRLLLELAWEGLEDAGQDLARLEHRRCGVFVGQWLGDFESRLFADPEAVDFFMTTGSGRYASSGRISYALGLRGPSFTIDSACSSSLVAVHLAVQSIRSGESELALAGGVNVILQPHISVAYSQSRMMAPDGRCKFGDASADGYVRSEGAGMVVLKRLSSAREDGDRIYAVIRGSAVNNDGRSSGSMGTPSRAGQEELLRTAYADAGVSPGSVGYIEAHGTGTRAGDPVELGALGAVLKDGRGTLPPCLVGSVKTNLGHTEGAAGIAGLIKATLALHHRAVPPSIHLSEPNPQIPWSEIPVRVPLSLTPWAAPAGGRFAGVSAFGIAGTNAHIVLSDEAGPVEAEQVALPAQPATDADRLHEPFRPARIPQVLPLSARSARALGELAARYADLLESDHAPDLDRLCWTAMTRKTALAERAVFIDADPRSLARSLREFAAEGVTTVHGSAHGQSRPRIAFVLPGQGAQWIGMGRELAVSEPVFRAALQACDRAAQPYLDCSILAQLEMEPSSARYRLEDIDVIQPALVAMAIGYAALWRSWGIVPDAVVGHSMGEVAAAHLAGVLDLDQAMRIICRRSALMRRTSGKGAMALVELSREEAEARIAGQEALMSVAVSNSPRSSVISGDPAAVSALLAVLQQEQVFCRLIKVDVASHSPQMEPLARELVAELRASAIVPNPAAIPIYSTVLGREASGAEFEVAYWGMNLRRPVLFSTAIDRMVADGFNVFIELGPHPVLLPSVEQTAQARGTEVVTLACGRRETDEQATMLAALGGLWANGGVVAWSRLMRPLSWIPGLPSYPWQRERHWLRAADNKTHAAHPGIEPLEGSERQWLHRPAWLAAVPGPRKTRMPDVCDRWLLVADRSDAVEHLASAFKSAGRHATFVPMTELASALAAGSERAAGIVLVASVTSIARPYDPIRLLQSVLSGLGTAADEGHSRLHPRLWLVTKGGQRVEGRGRARVDVLQGAMWGAGRVIAEEHPELWGGMIDIDPSAAEEVCARQVVAELTSVAPGPQVAYRQENRFVLRLQAADPGPDEEIGLSWRADSAYLITGGLGGIGLHIAAALVALGARRLVLMGRSAMPPRAAWQDLAAGSKAGRQAAAILALEAKGASVHLMQADVADEEDLDRALRQYERESWPAIRGVIHGAGLTENRLSHVMDPGSFERVFAPKARGALLLDRLLPDLDIFILLSSISASLGVAGMANYAAANVALDALAADRRARGLHALSIQWGAWRDTGLHSGEGAARKAEELERQGIFEIPPKQGVRLFAALHASSEPVLAVMPVDFSVLRTARAGRDLSLFEGRMPSLAEDPGAEGGLTRLLENAATPADRRLILLPLVKEIVGAVLKLAPSRLDSRRPLGTMGLTSLMAMELRNRLEALVSSPLSATLAWNYPTVDALVTFLAEGKAPAAPAPVAPRAPALATTEAMDLLMDLSDDDAAELLRRK